MKIIKIIDLIPIIFVIISFLLWNTYGKDKKINAKSKNELPSLPLPIISLIYNGSINKEDLIFFLLDLSNKGYIKIEEEKNNQFKITKLKEYEEKDQTKIFLDELFMKNNTISLDEYINIISSNNKKQKSLEQIKTIKTEELPRRFNFLYKKIISIFLKDKNKYYIKESEGKRTYLIIMLSIILLLITCYPFYELKMIKYIPFALLFGIGTLALVINFVNKLDIEYINRRQILSCTIILIVLWIIFLLPVFSITSEYLISYFIGTLSIILILVIYRYMPKRTKLCHRLRTEIENYKKYLLKQSREELEAILKEDEYYLFNLVPLSFILGINNTILNRMRDNKINKLKYYTLPDNYSVLKYCNSIARLMVLLNK